tara:strand:+ start:5525 stop:5836 length:312 start_codon:yes stop_codon:yes gene_type:complete
LDRERTRQAERFRRLCKSSGSRLDNEKLNPLTGEWEVSEDTFDEKAIVIDEDEIDFVCYENISSYSAIEEINAIYRIIPEINGKDWSGLVEHIISNETTIPIG